MTPTETRSERTRRATPMSPDERRRAIVDLVTPLFVAHGPTVTTRQMAEAAGVAEGTIFSVFPDKTAIIRAVLEASMEPGPVCAALAAIDPDSPLRNQLGLAAQVVEARSRRIWALGPLLRQITDPDDHGIPRFVAESGEVVMQSLTDLLERHRHALRVEPARAAVAFRGLMFANSYPTDRAPLSTDELVDLLLSGIGAD